MKLFSGIIAAVFAILISVIAGYFSITGLAALFEATFWPVIFMGTILEGGKLVATGWLHVNWSNPRVSFIHKSYLSFAILILMIITAIGIFGFLSKGHLEQEAPAANIQLQLDRKQAAIQNNLTEISRLNTRQSQLDAAVSSLIDQKAVSLSQKIRDGQKAEREQIARDQSLAERSIAKLNDEILPLKISNATVAAKLGPVKYVAELFGWNPDSAVRMIIVMIMIAFDPLALVLLISSTISFAEYFDSEVPLSEIKTETPSPVITERPEITTRVPVYAVGEEIPAPFKIPPTPPSEIANEISDEEFLNLLRNRPELLQSVIDDVVDWKSKQQIQQPFHMPSSVA